jgi:hypothetical protein
MWNPALEFAEASACHVEGWRRSFCFWVPLGRGTPELPGLMLALEAGDGCEGIAYRISPEKVRSELAILWNREMLSGIYQARWVPTRLRDGRIVTAVTFVVDTSHGQCRSSGRRITSPSPRAAAAPAATISPTPRPMPGRSTSMIPTSRSWWNELRACAARTSCHPYRLPEIPCQFARPARIKSQPAAVGMT